MESGKIQNQNFCVIDRDRACKQEELSPTPTTPLLLLFQFHRNNHGVNEPHPYRLCISSLDYHHHDQSRFGIIVVIVIVGLIIILRRDRSRRQPR